MLKTFTTAFVVAVSALTLGAKAPVEVRVNPRIGNAPKDATVYVKLEPHADNRWLTIAIDNGRYGSSTLKQLEGLDAPEAFTKTFSRNPEGHYIVVVALQRSSGEPIVVSTTFCLNGPNVSCAD